MDFLIRQTIKNPIKPIFKTSPPKKLYCAQQLFQLFVHWAWCLLHFCTVLPIEWIKISEELCLFVRAIKLLIWKLAQLPNQIDESLTPLSWILLKCFYHCMMGLDKQIPTCNICISACQIWTEPCNGCDSLLAYYKCIITLEKME